MNDSSTHDNFLTYFRYKSHGIIAKNITQVKKTMNKEDRNQYGLPFSNWIARFVKNLHLIFQGLLQKPGKNDRLIWNGSFQPTWDSKYINMMIVKKNEPELIYGHAFDRSLVEV